MSVLEGYNTATEAFPTLDRAIVKCRSMLLHTKDSPYVGMGNVLLTFTQQSTIFPSFVVGVHGDREDVLSIEYDPELKGWVVDAIP